MRDWRKLQLALSFARRNLDRNIVLSEWAANTKQSRFHAHRTLRPSLGETPKQYTLRLRIDHAAAALVSSRVSILNIALECGFESHEAFCRAFRPRFGLSPSVYRRRGLTGPGTRSHAALVDEIGPCVRLYHVESAERRSQEFMEYEITRQELTAQPVLVVRQRVRRAAIAATIGAVLPKVFIHAQQRGMAIAVLFAKMTPLFHDPALAPNALGSILCPDATDWSGVLEPQAILSISAFRSISNLRALIGAGGFEDRNDVWLALLATVGDLPIPIELSEDIRGALLSTEFLKLCERDTTIGMLAIAFATQHAAHYGREITEKVRDWLLRLAEAFHRRGEVEEAVKGQLLSAAFSLYSREVNVDRYRELAKVTAQIIQKWPAIASYVKIMVDRLVEEIPNADSRHLWRLQVELRRL